MRMMIMTEKSLRRDWVYKSSWSITFELILLPALVHFVQWYTLTPPTLNLKTYCNTTLPIVHDRYDRSQRQFKWVKQDVRPPFLDLTWTSSHAGLTLLPVLFGFALSGCNVNNSGYSCILTELERGWILLDKNKSFAWRRPHHR